MKSILLLLLALLFINCSDTDGDVENLTNGTHDTVSSNSLLLNSSISTIDIPISSNTTIGLTSSSKLTSTSSIDTTKNKISSSTAHHSSSTLSSYSSTISSSHDSLFLSSQNILSSSLLSSELTSSSILPISSEVVLTSSSEISSCSSLSSSIISSSLSSLISESSSLTSSSSSSSSSIGVVTETAPEAHNVCIIGNRAEGEVLQGTYDYYDLENDIEGASLFKWYRDGLEISGAVDTLYTLVHDDMGTILTFSVTPIAQDGNVLVGIEVTVSDTIYYENHVIEGGLVDSRDNESYDIVHIGRQIWMAENLRWLPQIDSAEYGSEQTGYENHMFYYVYEYIPNVSLTENDQIVEAQQALNYQTYGVLYNLNAAMAGESITSNNIIPSGVKGVCPEQYHFPSDAEWEELSQYIAITTGDTERFAFGTKITWNLLGDHLKGNSDLWSKYASGNDSVDSKGNDTFYFDALPGGKRESNMAAFFGKNSNSEYWTSVITLGQSGSMNETSRVLGLYNFFNRDNFNDQKNHGLSVRCIKNRP
ncbi:MAG: fibrobacter succinogenes major paralogous domain-containing protein [Fibrobacterales bacterium]